MPIKKQNIGSKKPATLEDLENLREDIHVDISQAEERINANTNQKIDSAKEEIIHQFKAAIEIIEDKLAGANKDEISGIKDKQRQHEKRLVQLEHKARII